MFRVRGPCADVDDASPPGPGDVGMIISPEDGFRGKKSKDQRWKRCVASPAFSGAEIRNNGAAHRRPGRKQGKKQREAYETRDEMQLRPAERS